MRSRRHRIIRRKGQRIAWTNTSSVPDEKVVEAIKFMADHVDLDATIVHVKHHGRSRWSHGVAYLGIPYIANTEGLKRWEWDYLITVTDASFVHTLAHEAKHVEQFREGKSKSELACEAFASGLAARFCTT